MQVNLTVHAEERLKQRLGLNRKAAKRYASIAFKEGIYPKDYYVKDIAKKYELAQQVTNDIMYLFYKDFVHVFAVTEDSEPKLVTLFDPARERTESFLKYSRGKLGKIKLKEDGWKNEWL